MSVEVLPEGKEPPPRGVRVMAIVRWLIVLTMAVFAVAAIVHGYGLGKKASSTVQGEVWYCPMHPSVVKDGPGECPICGMALVKRESVADAAPISHEGHRHEPSDPYACPMHPEETGLSADDRCPICFMRLEPKSSIVMPPPGLSNLELTIDRVQLIGMKTAKATKESLAPELRTVGAVAPTEQGLSKVTTRYSGFVEALAVAETGRKVKRGEFLGSVYSPDVYLAEQEYLTARGFAAEGDLAINARKRLELLGVGAGEIAAIEKNGKPSKTIGIFAPASGYIANKNAVVGLSFAAGTELFSIADLSKVWVIADIYEAELSRVALGQQAKLTLLSFPGRSWAGEVKLIYPNLDPATRTAKLRLEFKNDLTRDLELKPGMYGDVTIAMAAAAQAVVIPREALIDSGEHQYVFVDRGSGRFEPRKVAVGARVGDKVEIRNGVSEGETVVTTGNFLLDSESRLRAAIEGKK
jgi:Cu(I)/Ag(I) efflux system membrane fusion protein